MEIEHTFQKLEYTFPSICQERKYDLAFVKKICERWKYSSFFLAELIFQLIHDYWIIKVKFEILLKFPNKTQVPGLSKWLQRVWFCLITFLHQFTSSYCCDYCQGNSCKKKTLKLKNWLPHVFQYVSNHLPILPTTEMGDYLLRSSLENKLSIYSDGWLAMFKTLHLLHCF